MSTFEHAINDAKDRACTYQLVQQEFYTDPNADHLPHHDVESFYWVFLWAFVRAIPVDSADEANWQYDLFCQMMRDHLPGREESREQCLCERSSSIISGINYITFGHHFYKLLVISVCHRKNTKIRSRNMATGPSFFCSFRRFKISTQTKLKMFN